MPIKHCWPCLAALGTTLLFGAAVSPWQSKDFKDWTTADAQLIMRKSPWAKQMPMPAGGRPGLVILEHGDADAAPPAASLGNPSNTTSGANMSAAANPGSAGPADPSGTHNLPGPRSPSGASAPSEAPAPQEGLTIIWASAAPVRLAVLKLRSGARQPAEADVDRAMRATHDYVIAVVGLPAPENGFDVNSLKDAASLSIRGKAPAAAASADYRKIGNSDVYFFHFPKTALPVALADRQIDFKMTMGKIEVRKRFDLNEMQYHGGLAL